MSDKIDNQGSKDLWKLTDDKLVESDHLIDDNALLTEDDLKKPDPESLKACGVKSTRKACAGCTCGLAEEMEKEELEKIKANTQNAKSSCGSVSKHVLALSYENFYFIL